MLNVLRRQDPSQIIHLSDSENCLSQRGVSQVKNLSHMFEGITFDHIFSSPLYRAKQTAELINENRKNMVEILPELEEIESTLENLEQNLSEFKRKQQEISILFGKLEKSESQNILIVAHGNIMCFFYCYMLFGFEFMPKAFYTIADKIRFGLAGYSVFIYEKDSQGWSLDGWNIRRERSQLLPTRFYL